MRSVAPEKYHLLQPCEEVFEHLDIDPVAFLVSFGGGADALLMEVIEFAFPTALPLNLVVFSFSCCNKCPQVICE